MAWVLYSLHTSVLSLLLKTLLVQDPLWAAPRLLQLPDNYNIIFQYYHRKACTACKKVPKDPALCLVCGAFVCLKGVCCKQQGTCECVLVSFPAVRVTKPAFKLSNSCYTNVRAEFTSLFGSVRILKSLFIFHFVTCSTPNIVAQLQASFYW